MSTTAPAPRPIKGTVGSRVRVMLGATGSDWVLLLDEDDGNREWQTHQWSMDGGIPKGLANQLNNCTNKGRYVKEVGWGPRHYDDSSWFVHGLKRDGSSGYSWWSSTAISDALKNSTVGEYRAYFGSDDNNRETYVLLKGSNGYQASGNLDDHLKSRLKRMNEERKNIHFVRLFHRNAYFVKDSDGSEWIGLGAHCDEELKRGGQVEDIAVAGDGSWIIIRPSTYIASTGVDEALTNSLNKFYRQQGDRNANRSREILCHCERVQRETRERERAEREARERAQREQRDREEREAKERKAKAEAERLAKEMAEKEEAEKASALALILEERIMEDAKDIKLQEQALQKRKRSLRDSIEKMPDAQRTRIEQELSEGANSAGECVVCQHEGASRAVIPCGHQCLCDDCASKLATAPSTSQLCPLCRGPLDSTLKIFATR